MAEGFELYHVPQQSRRDKLRVAAAAAAAGCVEDLQGCAGLGLLPLYDPSSFHHHLLSCANTKQPGNNNITALLMAAAAAANHNINSSSNNAAAGVGGGGTVSSSVSNNNNSLDPQSIQDYNFLYTHQDLRLINHHHQQPFHGGGDLVLYRPEQLALSLSSQNTHNGNLPLELNLQRYESAIYGGGDLGRSTAMAGLPLGPFTGYASILKGSRFLKPAQQLLEEICDVGCGIYADKFAVESGLMMDPPPLESLKSNVDDPSSGGDGRKKSRLISMLDEVYKRYKQYYQQIQVVIASFEAVAGLSNAAPFANLDLKAMSKHFRCLKKAITDQLQFLTKPHEQHIGYGKEAPRSVSSGRALYGQRPVNNLGFIDHQPVWRPQRGLPERAVTVLRAWLFDHFLHPYPTDTDKIMLAKQTGLSRNQVSNWFINARVRLWKPMVEEIHTLETRQLKKASQQIEEQDTSPLGNPALSRDQPATTSPQRIKDPPPKRSRNDFTNNANNNGSMAGIEEPMNLLYDDFSRQQQVGPTGSTNRGVSLTLGLHQNNNGIALPEHFPLNAARRFGLDASSEGFVMSGFGAQNRQFGREIFGGQLLHDFVG